MFRAVAEDLVCEGLSVFEELLAPLLVQGIQAGFEFDLALLQALARFPLSLHVFSADLQVDLDLRARLLLEDLSWRVLLVNKGEGLLAVLDSA